MKKLGRAFLVLIAGLLSALALVASAAGTRAASSGRVVKHLQLPVGALAVNGQRVAYSLGSRYAKKPNTTSVLVWNVRTSKTVRVSGRKTASADNSSTGAGVFQLAIAGSRVAWLVNVGGNTEGDDYLFTSSATHPKERKVASASRFGDSCPGREASRCAGKWLGGLVGSGNLIAANRWTTDDTGAVTAGQLDVLSGTKLNEFATGADTVLATAADHGRVVVLRSDETVAMYGGRTGVWTGIASNASSVALNKHALVVLTTTRMLELYYAPSPTGYSIRCSVHASGTPQNLDVQGYIAIYSAGNSVHAVDLGSCKDRVIGTLHTRIAFARIDSAGLTYASNGTGKTFGKSTLVFVPLARVKAAVG